MMPALWVGKTGLEGQQTRLTSISNNLANVNTYGFKKDRVNFEDLIYQTYRQAGGQTSQNTIMPTGLNIGVGTRVVSSQKIHTQGDVIQTGHSLDLAIMGRGFFQITRPDGTIGYTRAGNFSLDDQGQMVTSSGYPLEPAIQIPADALDIFVGADGTVTVQQPGQAAPAAVGNITIADFSNPAGLKPIGENLFVETAASGAPVVLAAGENGAGAINQGMLETSNVNTAEELVNLIEAQRGYEVNAKSIAAANGMLQFLNNNV